MSNILVVAPHPDDETLGCGGTLLKHRARNDEINWLIFTGIENNYTDEQIQKRNEEIEAVTTAYSFKAVDRLSYPTAKLDTISLSEMIEKASGSIKNIRPEIIYLPFPGDVHSDHRIVFDVMTACTKQFRYSWVKKILAYETLSETEFNINPVSQSFKPNVFIDVSDFVEAKINIMNIYTSEVGNHPFPRSEKSIRALAAIRGAAANCKAAEAFMLLKEID